MLRKFKNYIDLAKVTEIASSSIATTATATSVALTGIVLGYSIPTALLLLIFVVIIKKSKH